MSAATTLFAPGFNDGFDDTDDVAMPGPFESSRPRRRHLAAVPVGVPAAVPARVPTAAPGARVAVLHAPQREAAPVRLTRRGVVVLGLLVAVVGGVLVWLAAASAPSDAAGPSGAAPAVVTVTSGDTLWSIASRVAPDTDPRAEVEHLRRLNHLDDVALVPGQQLRVR